MPSLTINKNGQGTVTIPRELIGALKWKSKDVLLISKTPGLDHLIIENVRSMKSK